MPYIMISLFMAVRMLRFGRKFLLRSGHGQGVGVRAGGLREPVVRARAVVTVVEVVVAAREVCVQRVEVAGLLHALRTANGNEG